MNNPLNKMDRPSARDLSQLSHWDNRYSPESRDPQSGSDKSHEWYLSKDLRTFVERHLSTPASNTTSSPSSPRILHLGCGTSTLTADLWSLGYRNQCNIDFSPVAIQTMRTRYAGLEAEGGSEGSLEWRVMDVRHMTFPPESFDVAIDKGTLDAIFYGSKEDPEEEVLASLKAYVDEVARVLRPGGRWLCVTHLPLKSVRQRIEREGVWAIEVETLNEEGLILKYSGFVMTKHP
jgi:EEF1A lysine methyltransferase 4